MKGETKTYEIGDAPEIGETFRTPDVPGKTFRTYVSPSRIGRAFDSDAVGRDRAVCCSKFERPDGYSVVFADVSVERAEENRESFAGPRF